MYCISLDNERNIWKGKLSKEQCVNMIEKHKCRTLYCIFLNSSNKSYSTKKKTIQQKDIIAYNRNALISRNKIQDINLKVNSFQEFFNFIKCFRL